MKINLGKIARGAVRFAKENPTLVVAGVTALAPKLARRVAPVLIPLVVKNRSPE